MGQMESSATRELDVQIDIVAHDKALLSDLWNWNLSIGQQSVRRFSKLNTGLNVGQGIKKKPLHFDALANDAIIWHYSKHAINKTPDCKETEFDSREI